MQARFSLRLFFLPQKESLGHITSLGNEAAFDSEGRSIFGPLRVCSLSDLTICLFSFPSSGESKGGDSKGNCLMLLCK